MAYVSAIALVVTLVGLALFQAGLAAGVPLGRFAWGGQHIRLPTGLRVGSLVAILIYAGFSMIMLQRAGVVALLPPGDWLNIVVWVVAGYFGLGIAMNAVSRSRPERLTMTPIAALLFVLSLIVALEL